MRKPRLFRWRDPDNTSGLLLFAQRIEEALFDYTMDSYKAPALNTHTRCMELVRSIAYVKSGQLTVKSLRSIVEELAWSLDRDPAARSLLGPLSVTFRNVEWWSVDDMRKLETQAELLKGRLRGRAYERELIAQISVHLADPHRKDELLSLTMNLLVEWLYRGYSRDFIFMSVRSVFFSPSAEPIDSNATFEKFVQRFQGEKQKHDVLLKAKGGTAVLSTVMPGDIAKVLETAPASRFHRAKELGFLKKQHDGMYVLFHNVEALDARAARNEAIRKLDIAARIASCHVHRDRITAVGEALVYCEGLPTVLNESPLPVHKENECALDDLHAAFMRTIGSLGPQRVPAESWARLMAALGLHASAISVKDTSVQLTSLWSALEALLPVGADQVKIAVVVEYLVPILCRRYPMRLLAQLESDFKTCCSSAYIEACAELPNNLLGNMKCAAIVAIQENEPLRDKLYNALGHNPLLRLRLFKLKSATDSADKISKLMTSHRQKVEWQVRRIYRSRNLMIHAGRTLPYQSSLVENLHSYFHRALDAISECVIAPHSAPDINSALLACQLEDKEHAGYLQRAGKTPTDYKTLAHRLAGPVFADANR